MVLDTVKLKNRKSTILPGMRGRDATEELHFTGIHDRYLRDQVCRESQLTIGWTEQKCIEIEELAKQDHTYRLSEEDNGISPRISPVETRICDFDQIFELQSLSTTVFIVKQVRKLQNQYLQHKKKMALFLKQFMVGQVRLELEMSS